MAGTKLLRDGPIGYAERVPAISDGDRRDIAAEGLRIILLSQLQETGLHQSGLQLSLLAGIDFRC